MRSDSIRCRRPTARCGVNYVASTVRLWESRRVSSLLPVHLSAPSGYTHKAGDSKSITYLFSTWYVSRDCCLIHVVPLSLTLISSCSFLYHFQPLPYLEVHSPCSLYLCDTFWTYASVAKSVKSSSRWLEISSLLEVLTK